jgi:hypothetical protein
MTTLIINDETKEGKAFIEYARKLPFVKAVGSKSNPVASEIRSSLREVKAGKRNPIDKLFV